MGEYIGLALGSDRCHVRRRGTGLRDAVPVQLGNPGGAVDVFFARSLLVLRKVPRDKSCHGKGIEPVR